MSHSTDGSGMLMNFAAVATLGKMWFCSAWSSHKELSIAWLFRGSRSSMMYGSKLTRKEYPMINALVQDVSFIADLHITANTDDHSSCRPLCDTPAILCWLTTNTLHHMFLTHCATQSLPVTTDWPGLDPRPVHCDICGGLNDTETVLYLSTFIFPVSITPSMLHTY